MVYNKYSSLVLHRRRIIYTYTYTLETKLYTRPDVRRTIYIIWYDIIYDIKSLQQQRRATNGGAVKFSGGDEKPPHQIERLHVIIITMLCVYLYVWNCFWFFLHRSRYIPAVLYLQTRRVII